MVDNPELYSKCKTAIIKCLGFLHEDDDKPATAIQENFDDIMKKSELQELEKYMANMTELTSKIKKLVTPNDEDTIRDQVRHVFIEKFFQTYLRRYGIPFNEKNFLNLYYELESYIYDKADYRYLAPLFNLILDDKTVKIEDLVIRYIEDKEFQELFVMPREFRDLVIDFYNPRVDYLVETKSKRYDINEQQRKINDFLSALGIFKMEPIQIRDIVCILPTFYPVEQRSRIGMIIRRGQPSTYPKLSKQDVPRFSKFYSRYKTIEKPRKLKNAIQRFNYGLQSLSFEDKVIDFMISLESLFGSSAELTHKISIRVALLLGQNDFDTECLRNFVKKMYNLRSKIVHGDDTTYELQKIKITKNRAKEKLKTITRDSIISYLYLLESGIKSKDIPEYLDTAISNQTVREEIRNKSKTRSCVYEA